MPSCVSPMQYTVVAGEQKDQSTFDELRQGDSFKVMETAVQTYRESAHSAVKYDLIGRIADDTQLTRRTVAAVLQGINVAVFGQYKTNPKTSCRKPQS